MKEPHWLTLNYVLAFHAQQIKEHGGLPGIRDKGMLESALTRPQHQFYYKQVDLFKLAASYAFGIIKNHPFIDGNKRTAITSAGVFLMLNSFSLNASEIELFKHVVALAGSTMNERDFSQWLKDNCTHLQE